MTVTERPAPAATRVSVHLRLARVDGAFERLVAVLFRKRVTIVELHLTRDAGAWDVMLDADLDPDRGDHVLAALAREPLVLAVADRPEGGR